MRRSRAKCENTMLDLIMEAEQHDDDECDINRTHLIENFLYNLYNA